MQRFCLCIHILSTVMNQQTCIIHVVSTLNHRRHRCHATLCQPPPPPLPRERPLLRRPIPSKQIAGNYTYTLRGTTTDPTNNSLCGVALSQPLAPRASLSLPRRPPARSHVVYGPQTLGRIAGASSSSAERASDISAHACVSFDKLRCK